MNAGWLKGNLPGWLVAGLLAFSLWTANRWFSEMQEERKEVLTTIQRHDISIRLVEGKISVLERGQDMQLMELKEIRKAIQEGK